MVVLLYLPFSLVFLVGGLSHSIIVSLGFYVISLLKKYSIFLVCVMIAGFCESSVCFIILLSLFITKCVRLSQSVLILICVGSKQGCFYSGKLLPFIVHRPRYFITCFWGAAKRGSEGQRVRG
jgi:hypothetical protein